MAAPEGFWACWLTQHLGNTQLFQVAYRWGHTLSALGFGGLTLFFNFLMGARGKAGEISLSPRLLARALAWWRWCAAALFFFGLNLLHMFYDFPYQNYFHGAKGRWMAMGALLGSLLIALAWAWVWPAQKRHLRGGGQGLAPGAQRGLRAITLLLGPTVLAMLMATHGLSLFEDAWLDLGSAFALGSLPVALLYGLASRRLSAPQK